MAKRNKQEADKLIETMTLEEIATEAEDTVILIKVKCECIIDEILCEDPLREFYHSRFSPDSPEEFNRMEKQARADTTEYLENVSGRIEKECLELMKKNARLGELTKVMAAMKVEIPW